MVRIRLLLPARMVQDSPQILCLVLGFPRAVSLSHHLSHHLSPGPNRAQLPRVPLGGIRAWSGSPHPPGPMWSPYGRWSDSDGLGPGHRYHSSSLPLLGTACPRVSYRACRSMQAHRDATMHHERTHDVAYTGATSQSSREQKDVTIHLEKLAAAARKDAAKIAAAADNCSLKPGHALAACPGGPHAGEACMVDHKNIEVPLLAHCTRSRGKYILGPSPIV